MSVCAFNSLPKGEYQNLFIAAAFPSKSFSGKTSFPVKNSDLLTPDDIVNILALCHSKLHGALFCSILLLIALIFSLILIFITSSF